MPARLHYISRYFGDGTPSRWVVLLHGILGSGSNWAQFASDLARRKPGWGLLAVDLRHHGRSETGSAPDGVAACVEDLVALCKSERFQIGAVVGHSFGSKIALRLCAEIPGVSFCASVDADPGPLSTEGKVRDDFPVLRLLDALRQGPQQYDSREDFVTEMSRAGFAEGIAGWVGKNLKRNEGHLILDLDLDRIEAMLDDHHRLDLWGLVESPVCDRLEFYIGGKSRVVPESSRKRLAALAQENPRRIGMTVVEDAGHWIHVERPEALLELLLSGIPD